MRGEHFAIEHAEQFLFERLAFDAVGVENGRMRRETRPDGRGGMFSRPVDELGQCRPIRLVLQLCGPRLSAGHDQPVEARVPELGNIAVSFGEFRPRSIGARELRKRKQLEANDHIGCRRLDQIEELPLGRFPRRIGHVVDEPDGQAISPRANRWRSRIAWCREEAASLSRSGNPIPPRSMAWRDALAPQSAHGRDRPECRRCARCRWRDGSSPA